MTQIKIKPSDLIDPVKQNIDQTVKNGMLDIPKDYSVVNALMTAYYIVRDTVQTSDHQAAFDVCSRESIIDTFRKMVIFGLNPAKTQCYFMAVKSNNSYVLKLLDSYYGDQALAIRFGNLKSEPSCNIVYEGDKFETEIDPNTGYEKLKFHNRGKSRDRNKIVGAYAMAVSETGRIYFEYMEFEAIKRAWLQGNKLMKKQGLSTFQENFNDRACKRTVIRRLCKEIFNTSSDMPILVDMENKKQLQENVTEYAEHEVVEIEAKDKQPDTHEQIESKTTKDVVSQTKLGEDFD